MGTFDDRLRVLADDGALDLEDVDHALAALTADGSVSPADLDAMRYAALLYAGLLEPGAATYLAARATGAAARAPNRVLLAPHPRNQAPDVYYPRNDVVALQEGLTTLGYPTTADGDYGPGTVRSVQALQTAVSLPATGVVDSATLRAINERLSTRGAPLVDVALRDRIRPDLVITARGSLDTAANLAVQQAMVRLSDHYHLDRWRCPTTGTFDDATERAVAAFQAIAWLPATGIVDTATSDAINESLRLGGLAPLTLPAPAGNKAGKVELHFYPGEAELKVYVLRDGAPIDVYPMVGASRIARDDPNNPTVDYSPTPAGSYEVVEVSPHASGAWSMSYVPYGARLREVNGEVQFQDGKGRWAWATGPQGVFRGRNPPPLERADYLEADGTLMPTWRLNDFGHLRGRLRNLRTGQVVSHMIHSSPDNELTPRYYADTRAWLDSATAVAELRYSHGCEHIHPRDFDEMVSKGYLSPGAKFVVHGYDERYGGAPLVA